MIPEPLDVRRSDEPHDRLTRICDRMTKVFNTDVELQPKDKCVVFLDDGARASGMVINGYADDFEGVIAVLVHLRAIFRANGQDLELIALDDDGVTR